MMRVLELKNFLPNTEGIKSFFLQYYNRLMQTEFDDYLQENGMTLKEIDLAIEYYNQYWINNFSKSHDKMRHVGILNPYIVHRKRQLPLLL